MELILQRLDNKDYHASTKKYSRDYLNKFGNCALVSSNFTDEWLIIKNPSQPHLQRRLHCFPCLEVSENYIFVQEDVYFNLCNALRLEVFCDYQSVAVEFNAFDPPVAQSVKVAPISSAYHISKEDEETLLDKYFDAPKFLYLHDVFAVALSTDYCLEKSATYYGVLTIHFKVVSAICASSSDVGSGGFFLFKGFSELYCLSPIPSYLPPKASMISVSDKNLKRVPPDLECHVSLLNSLFLPFTKPIKPKCLPFFLLSGCQGSGKALALQLVCESLGLHLITISSFEFSDVGVNAAETKLDILLQRTLKAGPCVLAVTDFQWIGRDKEGNEDARLVCSFLSQLNKAMAHTSAYPLLFIGVTDKKVKDILACVTRAALQVLKFSSLDAETALRTVIWIANKKGLRLSERELHPIAKRLTGFTHSDLNLLVNHAIRNMHQKCDDSFSLMHFEHGLDLMEKAYSDAIGVAKVPNVRWDDVGGLNDVKMEIKLTLKTPVGGFTTTLHRRRSGILFYGPPGTGKTLMAKAVATECSMNFLSVKGPELMNMYVGQSESNVREVFARGREAAPCILFFDELDSLAPNRGKSGDGGNVTDRVVSQLLAEMDGLQSNKGLFIIAATNRPDLVDTALLRPGRFDKMFYLGPLVDTDSKLSVLKALTNKFVLSDDINFMWEDVAEVLPSHVTGADLYSVCSNAWLSAARRAIDAVPNDEAIKLPLKIKKEDFATGISEMVPSLTKQDLTYYEQLAASTSSK